MADLSLHGIITFLDIAGNLTSGNNSPIYGSMSLPMVLDHTAIHYDTSAGWASKPTTVGLPGNIYIYSDYKVIQNEDETYTIIPAFKIADGVTLLRDLPFNTEDGNAQYDEDTETLILIF